MTQFSVHRSPGKGGGCLVDGQSDLLDDLATRAVVPLLRRQDAPKPLTGDLNPVVSLDGEPYVLMTQMVVAIPARLLGSPVGNLSAERDRIIRAIDILIGGV